MAVQPKITINTDPAAAAAAIAAAAPGAAQQGQSAAGRAARRAMAEQARKEARSGKVAGQAEADQEKAEDQTLEPREPIDSLTFELPNGCIVEFGPPVGESLTVKMLQIYGNRDFSRAEEDITWTMCCLRTVDEKPVRIGNTIDRDKWITVIGDEGLGILRTTLNRYWPPLRRYDLKIIEKKMR
ncbi:MAG TPA: hypothetical protein VL614_14890 [Acetobacteraceae bacterium]|jgi:hypothetical protein|nr:hypothetical protein [Acetobacteraceae bacterium]